MNKEQVNRYVESAIKHPDRFLIASFAELTHVSIPIRFAMTGEKLPIQGILPDSISRYMFLMEGIRAYEPETTKMIKEVTQVDDTVMVIGSHIGLHALLAKQIVGENGIVVAFEPTPQIYQLLVQNCQSRGVVTEPLAVTDNGLESISMTIHNVRHSAWNTGAEARSKVSAAWSPQQIDVAATSIDQYCNNKDLTPNVLIFDLENGEMQALQGGEEIILSSRPRVIIECGDLGRTEENNTHACLSKLQLWGYQFFEFDQKIASFKSHEILPNYPDDYPNVLAVHVEDHIINQLLKP